MTADPAARIYRGRCRSSRRRRRAPGTAWASPKRRRKAPTSAKLPMRSAAAWTGSASDQLTATRHLRWVHGTGNGGLDLRRSRSPATRRAVLQTGARHCVGRDTGRLRPASLAPQRTAENRPNIPLPLRPTGFDKGPESLGLWSVLLVSRQRVEMEVRHEGRSAFG